MNEKKWSPLALTAFMALSLSLPFGRTRAGGTSCAALLPLPSLGPLQKAAVHTAAQQALDAYPAAQPDALPLVVMSAWGEDDWAVVELLRVLPPDAPGGSESVVMLLERQNGAWQAALPGASVYAAWLEQIPAHYMTQEHKSDLRALSIFASDDLKPPSDGIYRLPYADGASVYVAVDSEDHSGPLDLWSANDVVVAAADGQVEKVVDDHSECCCDDPCSSCNNKVVLRHSNDEYTTYYHIAAGSAQVSVGQEVTAGTVLATQGDVGQTCGSGRTATPCEDFTDPTGQCSEHLHFAVHDGAIDGPTRAPRFCDGQGGWFYPETGQTWPAQDCQGEPIDWTDFIYLPLVFKQSQ
jgi:hypothetical protein